MCDRFKNNLYQVVVNLTIEKRERAIFFLNIFVFELRVEQMFSKTFCVQKRKNFIENFNSYVTEVKVQINFEMQFKAQ